MCYTGERSWRQMEGADEGAEVKAEIRLLEKRAESVRLYHAKQCARECVVASDHPERCFQQEIRRPSAHAYAASHSIGSRHS